MAVGTSNFPASVDTTAELIQPANNAATTLSADLNSTATTIVVASTAAFSSSGLIAIGTELISYTGKTSTSFTGCVRGFDGTTAASYGNGATVEDRIARAHHNVLSTAIISTQTKLGSGASTSAVNTVLRGTGAGSSAWGPIVNTDIDPTAAIAYSKLALTGAIVNADIANGAAVAYSKLALTGAIVNADVATGAAIAYSKLALTGAIVNADIATGAAVAYSKLALTGAIVNADIATGAAIDYAKLATLTTNRLLVSSGAGAVSASSLTWNATDSAIGAIKAIDFTGVTTTPVPLRLQWNTDLATAEIGLTSAFALPLGQSEVVLVKRSTNNGLVKGKVVYVVGSDGVNKTVDYALATSNTTGDTTLGIIAETVTGGNKAFCITSGYISGITTTGLTEGAPVYLSAASAGDLVASVPTPPNHRIQIGYCVKEHANQGVIYVSIRTAYELGELCDVSATNPVAAGSTLIRNATTGVWTAARLTAGSGITITNGDGAITITSTGSAAGSTGDYQINNAGAFAAGVLTQSSGRLTSTATAASGGVVPYLRIRTPTDTGLTASTEAPGIVFGGDASGATVTRTRAAGAVTTQRENVFTAPTYAAVSATTITTAATLGVDGPLAGSNVTINEQYAALFRNNASNLFGTFTGQIACQNQNASGWVGVDFKNSSGTTRAGLTWVPGGTDSLRMYWIGNFFIGDPSASCFTTNSTNYNIAMGTNVAATDAQLLVMSQSTAKSALRLSQPSGSTVNAFEVQAGSDNRYNFFLNATESRQQITGPNGGHNRMGLIAENVTLSTAGATTDTTIQIPANSLVLGVTVRVTTGITGIDSTALQVGDATTAARFGSIAAFTAGTTGVGLNHLQGGISTDAAGPIVTSATAIRLTLSGGADNTPSAGAVRVTIHYIALTAPTS